MAVFSSRRREIHVADRSFYYLLKFFGFGLVALIFAIAWQTFSTAHPTLSKSGFSFLFSEAWDPNRQTFGAAAFVFGTLTSSLLALLIAVPVSVGSALFLNEIAPKSLARVLGFSIEMLAAIPSVIYGLWGVFVLAPWLRVNLEPYLAEKLGFLPIFQGPQYGFGMLAAGIILAIMIIPTISAICKEVFAAIPMSQREGALALGATRWEMIYVSVLRSSYSGVLGAVILGLGRALGETMAVTMVIGNRPIISASLFSPAQTMSSVIANEYPEAGDESHRSALAAIGISLLLVSLMINLFARFLVWRSERRNG